mgnify:CR=1 FL=1
MMGERIILPNGRRFHIECGIEVSVPSKDNVTETKVIKRIRPFKYDPGSQITCIPASVLDVRMTEDEFVEWSDNHRTEGIPPFSVSCTGIDSSAAGIRFYYIQTEAFYIQSMNLGSVPMYITFDPRYRKLLLGLDLLRLLNIQQDIDANEIRMQIANKVADYKKNHLRITVKSMYELGIYSDEDGVIDFSSILSTTSNP